MKLNCIIIRHIRRNGTIVLFQIGFQTVKDYQILQNSFLRLTKFNVSKVLEIIFTFGKFSATEWF